MLLHRSRSIGTLSDKTAELFQDFFAKAAGRTELHQQPSVVCPDMEPFAPKQVIGISKFLANNGAFLSFHGRFLRFLRFKAVENIFPSL